jgi:hypothetical protein
LNIYNSITPKQGLSWYVKWIASLFLISSMVVRSTELSNFLDMVLSLMGVMGWFWVACLWKDRALLVLNSLAIFILVIGILQKI